MNILIINGPNLNLLGQRNRGVYGSKSMEEFLKQLTLENLSIQYFQSNSEGEIIDKIQACKCDGIILNAGGYSHTSVAIRDAIEDTNIPVIEVHISNISSREVFRHDSLLTPVCVGCIFGFGLKSYELALNYFYSQKS